MSNQPPRLRMFAGPNGSGKTTIKTIIRPELLGVYVNPDEIEQDIMQHNFLDFSMYETKTTQDEILNFLKNSTLLNKENLADKVQQLHFNDNKLIFPPRLVNSYFASVIADFIRQKLIETKKSFTLETVMSSPDKIELLQKAQATGYRTYLYYIATEDPSINVSRVQHRVKMGNHDVPKDKIISRYERSLSLLLNAIRHTNRAYVFDNSESKTSWIAEITNGTSLESKINSPPLWFKQSVLDKIDQQQ